MTTEERMNRNQIRCDLAACNFIRLAVINDKHNQAHLDLSNMLERRAHSTFLDMYGRDKSTFALCEIFNVPDPMTMDFD